MQTVSLAKWQTPVRRRDTSWGYCSPRRPRQWDDDDDDDYNYPATVGLLGHVDPLDLHVLLEALKTTMAGATTSVPAAAVATRA